MTSILPAPTDPATKPEVNVFAVHGAEPEVQAYAMAKYSRSALSMKESLRQISEQKAEQFLNTFYFQYGHRSIADLAHVAFAIERLSMLAAITVVDEQRWDGQERSTRYQDFKKSGYYVPSFADSADEQLYRQTIDSLFSDYDRFSEGMWRHLAERVRKPDDMKQEAYERTLRARAFDITRYFLPLATMTSLGQIVNARTLETQIARLLSHTHAEVRELGELLKRAASEPAYNVMHDRWRSLIEELRALNADAATRAESELMKETRVAPTLVKYANPSPYEIETRDSLRLVANEVMKGADIAMSNAVTLLDDDPLELELATSLLYQHCHYPYRQIRRHLESEGEKLWEEIIGLGTRHRGKHDELLRAFCGGQRLRFDILMDIGAFRDMHRHRRCIQIEQGYTIEHGYDTPEEISRAGISSHYNAAMERAAKAYRTLASRKSREAAETAEYVIPMAYRKRCLFKMDFAEALYISELRTGPAGHISYRLVAWEMYQAVARKYPSLAKHFRVTDPREPVDLLRR